MNEQCDSKLFLLDLEDPDGEWREGTSFPGDCGLGQTMNTVNIPRDDVEDVGACLCFVLIWFCLFVCLFVRSSV